MSGTLDAALAFAAEGMPVFPCSAESKRPLLLKDKDKDGKPINGTGWLTKKSTDSQQIRTWWKRWPNAMIGLATGHDRIFVLDFDPRTDAQTGEVFTLERLKADLEAQIGCPLPPSRVSITQSGGVHLWLRWRDDGGDPIRNRGNLPLHVDVRGLGGYVIVPPSVMDSGKRYRWHGERGAGHPVSDAPEALIAILRAPKSVKPAPARQTPPARPDGQPSSQMGDAFENALRKYGDSALAEECRQVRNAGSGGRNAQLNASAYAIASLVAAGAIEERWGRSSIEAAARDNPGRDDDGQLIATINSGWEAGMSNPRDLSALAESIAARGRTRPTGKPGAAAAPSPRTPAQSADFKPSSQSGQSGGKAPPRKWAQKLTRECALLPQTDAGNMERFLARFGSDFRHVPAWGWIAWDGQRWNRDRADSLLGNALHVTIRAIQDEAAEIAQSDVISDAPLTQPDLYAVLAKIGPHRNVWYPDPDNPRGDDWFDRHGEVMTRKDIKGAYDRVVQIKERGRERIVLLSDKIAQWGRSSESGGHVSLLNKPEWLQSKLAAMADDFDSDAMMLNVLNGTLVFARNPGGRATVTLKAHDRADMITKLANAAYDPPDPARGHEGALCPEYDAYLERVQPDAEMRHFLDCWGGYNALGDTSAQVFALFYGQGANGKSVWVDAHAHVLADYARVCGIETFIDQGRYRKGSDATPDLAALAGRRMVRASEPERGAKFSDGLIKALTGTEPMPVRELNKPPFEMTVSFKATISANLKPQIGTDHGIQRRVRLVPWGVIIPDEEQDRLLLTRIKAEADGLLLRMVNGAIAYLGNGLPLPQAIEEATREYREENDLLGRFLTDCIAPEKGNRVNASDLHRLFVAWQTAMGEIGASGKPWTPKYLGSQLRSKGVKDMKSSSIWWLDIKMIKDELDYSESNRDEPDLRASGPPESSENDEWGAL